MSSQKKASRRTRTVAVKRLVCPERHELADIFPELPWHAQEELVASIREHGLLEPITLFRGRILDGRHRFSACRLANVKPRYVELPDDTDPIAFIIAKNLLRRHLTTSQRAMCAERLATVGHGGARKKQAADLPLEITQAKAASLLGVSQRSVRSARAVVRNTATGIESAVRWGKLSIGAALELSKLPRNKQKLLVNAGVDIMRAEASKLRRGKHPTALKVVETPPPDPDSGIIESPQEFDALFLRNTMLRYLAGPLGEQGLGCSIQEHMAKTFFNNVRAGYDVGVVEKARQAAIDVLMVRESRLVDKLRTTRRGLGLLRIWARKVELEVVPGG